MAEGSERAAAVARVTERLARDTGVPVRLPGMAAGDQRGQPDPPYEARRDSLLALSARDPEVFLERYGAMLTGAELALFEGCGDGAMWHVSRLRGALGDAGEAGERIRWRKTRNRRIAYLARYANQNEFFSDENLRMRHPELFEQYVGRYLPAGALQPQPFAKGTHLYERLLASYDLACCEDRRLQCAGVSADEREHRTGVCDTDAYRPPEPPRPPAPSGPAARSSEAPDGDGDGDEDDDMGGADDAAEEQQQLEQAGPEERVEEPGQEQEEGPEGEEAEEEMSDECREAMRAYCVEIARERFLDGLDKPEFVDYALIDADETLDDVAEMERDIQDDYFDDSGDDDGDDN
eukprot:m51a1_g11422 hypothetical protein (350) ;mRNA; r:7935-9586